MRQQPKVILLEDDQILASQCQSALEQSNFLVEVLPNGSEGFYAFHVRGCDLLIANFALPGMSGLEILQKIRIQKQYVDFPVIVLAHNFQIHSAYSELKRARPSYILPRHPSAIAQVSKVANLLLSPESLFNMPYRGELALPLSQLPKEILVPEPRNPTPEAAEDPFAWEVRPPRRRAAPVSASRWDFEDNFSEAQAVPADFKDKSPVAEPVEKEILPVRTSEEMLQDMLLKTSSLRRVSKILGKSSPTANSDLRDFYASARALASMDCGGYEHIREFAVLLEAFILQSCDNPAKQTGATSQTLARALDLMEKLILRRNDFKPQPVRSRSIAILDHDPSARLMLKLAILRLSAKAHEFDNEQEALNFIGCEKVDLFVVSSDFVAAQSKIIQEKIRQNSKNPEMPMALVGEKDTLSLRVQCFSEKAAILLTKPFTILELAVRISMAFLLPVLWNPVPAGVNAEAAKPLG